MSFCFFTVQILSAQREKNDQSQIYANIDKTIVNINRLLGSDCKIGFNEELIVTFFEQGIPFREDRVYPDALDPHKVRYIAEEKAVSVQCLEFNGLEGKLQKRYGEGCIWREFSKDKKILTYSRITFRVDGEKTAENLQKELIKLIRYGHELTFKKPSK